VKHAKYLEDQINGSWSLMLRSSQVQLAAQDYYTKRTEAIVKDPELLAGMLPKWSVGCRYVAKLRQAFPVCLVNPVCNEGESRRAIRT
jgi:hypothetical protein